MTENEHELNNKVLVILNFSNTSLSNTINSYCIVGSKAINLLLFVFIFISVTSTFYYRIFDIDLAQIIISSFFGFFSMFTILCSFTERKVDFGVNTSDFFEKFQQKNDLDFNLQLLSNLQHSIDKNLATIEKKSRFLKFGIYGFCIWVLFMICSMIVWR